MTAHLNTEGSVYQEVADEDYWIQDEQGNTLLQDFGHFTVATVDITEVAPNCNCINTARAWYKQLIKKNVSKVHIPSGTFLGHESRHRIIQKVACPHLSCK